jgi:hypothetical protein
MNLTIVVDDPVRPYCEGGLWIARCPQPWCVGADHYGPGPQTGRIGGLGEDRFICPRCANTAEVVWPPNMDDIMHVLMLRPMPETRNWRPGEEVADLLVENAVHGIGVDKLAGRRGIQLNADRFADRTALAGRTLHAIGG